MAFRIFTILDRSEFLPLNKNTMKRYLLISACMIFGWTCQGQASLDDVAWLNGKWNRTNAKPGRSGMEQWKKISATELQGEGINLKGVDTVFVERLKIILKESQLYYVADITGNKEPVYFKFTNVTPNGFVCENPQHDFPKKIVYAVEDNKLKATISGDGKQIDYLFEKAQ
jgi:hypothetical protein